MEAEVADENTTFTNGRSDDSDSVIGDSEPKGRSGSDQISSPQKPAPTYNPYQQFVATRPPEQSRAPPQGNPNPRPELRNYSNPNVRPPPQGYPPSGWNRAPPLPHPLGDPRTSLGFRPANPPEFRPQGPVGPPGAVKPPEYRAPGPQHPDYRFQNPEFRGPAPPSSADYRLKSPPGPPQTLKYRQPINPEYRPRPPLNQPRPSGDPRLPLNDGSYRQPPSPGTPEYRPPYRPQEYQPPRRENEVADNGDYYDKQKKVTFDPNVQRSDTQLQSPTSESRPAPPTSIIRRQSAWTILKENLPTEPRTQNTGPVELQQKSSTEYIRTTGGPNMNPTPVAYPPRVESPKPTKDQNFFRVPSPGSIGSDNSVVEGKIPPEMIRMNSKPAMSPASRDSGRETPTRGGMTPDGRDSPTPMHYPPVTGSYRPASGPQYMVRRDSNDSKLLAEPRPSTGGERGRETLPVGVRPRADDDSDVVDRAPLNRYMNSQRQEFPQDGSRNPSAGQKPRTPATEGRPEMGRPESPAPRFDGPNPMSPTAPGDYRSKPGTPRTGSPMIQRLDSRASIYDPAEKFGEPVRSPAAKSPLPPKPQSAERVPSSRYPDTVQSPTSQGPRPPDFGRPDDYPRSPDPNIYGPEIPRTPRPGSQDYVRTPPRTPKLTQNGGPDVERESIGPSQVRIQKPDSLDLNSVTAKMTNGIKTPDHKSPDVRKTRIIIEDGDHDSGVDESTQRKESSTNGDCKSPLKSPTKIPGLKKSPSTRTARTPTRTAPKTPDEANETQEKKKVPMNKIQVGAAPSPNLKTVTSKIGSLQNTSYKPGGGKVKIESKKLDWKAAPRIAAKNENYQPSGGEKKIQQQKLTWTAKSKVGSLENSTYKPGGGDKKIETIKLDFKDKAKPKIASKDNVKHVPGGGAVKTIRQTRKTKPTNGSQIEEHRIEIKAHSKIGSLDNVKYKPGGGDKKIFDDKEYLKQMANCAGKSDSEHASASQNRSKSASRKSSRDRRSPIHLTPNGLVPIGLEDGKSEKTTDQVSKLPDSSPLSDSEKGKVEESVSPTTSAADPKSPVIADSAKSDPSKDTTQPTPTKTTDSNENKIDSRISADIKSDDKRSRNELSRTKVGPETPDKKDEPTETQSKPENISSNPITSSRPGSRDSDEAKTPKPPTNVALEKIRSPDSSSNNPTQKSDGAESKRPASGKELNTEATNKPPTPALNTENKPSTPNLVTKPATSSVDVVNIATNSVGSKPPTPSPDPNKSSTPNTKNRIESPLSTKDGVVPEAKLGMPQPAPRSETPMNQPKNISRPPTGERRLEAQKQSPDFSPKFGIREPPSPKEGPGKRFGVGTPPGDQSVRFDDTNKPQSPVVKREAMSPSKRPDPRNDPTGMRPKTSDGKLQDVTRETPKSVKNIENTANQRQEQYQTMKNLADRSRVGTPSDLRQASIGDNPELPRSAPPNPKVVMPPNTDF